MANIIGKMGTSGQIIGKMSGQPSARLEQKIEEIDSRVDTIITTPVEGVSAQEIIDARQGALSVGANITDVKSQLADITSYPVKYGAVGNGTGNDTTPFQSALDNAVEGGVVDLEGKHYAITGVTINKKLHLKNGKITLLNSAIKSVVELTNLATGSKVSDLEIYIDKVNVSGTEISGIYVNNADNVTVDNCYVNGSKNNDYPTYFSSSIFGYMSNNLSVIDSTVENAHHEGIMTRDCDDVWISGCKAFNCGYSGIGTSRGKRAVIDHCVSIGSGASSITANSQDTIVSNCLVSGNKSAVGINAGHNTEPGQYIENCVITGNRIIDAFSNGISVAYALNVTVTGNTITECGSRGIYVLVKPDVKSSVVVTGNAIDDCAGDGLSVQGEKDTTGTSESNIIVNSNSINNCRGRGTYFYGVTGVKATIEVMSNILKQIGTIGILADYKEENTININANIFEKCTSYGVQLTTGGYIHISDNIIKDTYGGIVANGVNDVTSVIATIDKIVINHNQIINCQRNGVQLYNLLHAIIRDNDFENINTAAYSNYHVIKFVNASGGLSLPLPNVFITGNTTKETNSNSVFVQFAANSYDGTIKQITVTNNELSDLDTGHFVQSDLPTNRLLTQGNIIGDTIV